MKCVTLLLMSLLLITAACNKQSVTPANPDNRNPPPPPPPVADSVSILRRIHQPYSFSTDFKYDGNNRVRSYGYYGSYYDTTAILYDNAGKPLGVAHYKREYFGHRVTPTVFVYQGGRVTKLVEKRYRDEGSYTPDYLTSYDNPADYNYYDSLVYNNAGKITATYRFSVSYPQTPVLWQRKELTYNSSNDSLLQKVDVYARNNGVVQLDYSMSFYTFDNAPNPFYNLVPFYPFIGMKSHFYILSHYHTDNYAHQFLCYSPHNSTSNSMRSRISYTYNSEALPIRSVIGDDQLEAVGYLYERVKK